MADKDLSICLTGATGWLGRSLLEVPNDSTTPHRFSIYGRNSSTILNDLGKSFKIKPFDLQAIAKDEFEVMDWPKEFGWPYCPRFAYCWPMII